MSYPRPSRASFSIQSIFPSHKLLLPHQTSSPACQVQDVERVPEAIRYVEEQVRRLVSDQDNKTIDQRNISSGTASHIEGGNNTSTNSKNPYILVSLTFPHALPSRTTLYPAVGSPYWCNPRGQGLIKFGRSVTVLAMNRKGMS